jgi:hypothetical protein
VSVHTTLEGSAVGVSAFVRGSNVKTIGQVRGARAIASVVIASVALFVFGLAPAGATISSDQASLARLRVQIAGQTAGIQALVKRINDAQARLTTINTQIEADRVNLAAEDQKADNARSVLRRFAVQAYVDGDALATPVADVGNATNVGAFAALNQYAGATSSAMNNALAAFQDAQQHITRDVAHLHNAQAETTATVRQLTAARSAAQTAIAQDETNLQQVSTDLRLQLIAASERQAAQAAAERALAAQAAHASHTAPHFVIPHPRPGQYQNPLRDVQDLIPERIDQGVDYSGVGPVHALGDGVVLATTIPGWPNNTNIVYELTDGPATGFVVYVAEDLVPAVKVGDTVHANTIIGRIYPGPDGIETGWGNPTITGNTIASAYRQFDGTNTTAFGENFSQLLHALGAPSGIPQNTPATGTLPRGWPHW